MAIITIRTLRWVDTQTFKAAVMLQALRRDLRALEDDARALATELEDATDWNPGQGSLQQLEGRFLCLAGMYKAHSQVSFWDLSFLFLPVTTVGETSWVLRHDRSYCLWSVEKRGWLGTLLLTRTPVQ